MKNSRPNVPCVLKGSKGPKIYVGPVTLKRQSEIGVFWLSLKALWRFLSAGMDTCRMKTRSGEKAEGYFVRIKQGLGLV